MNSTEHALSILARIRYMIQTEEIGANNPQIGQRLADLIRILQLDVQDFLPGDPQRSDLREQVKKLADDIPELNRSEKPLVSQNHLESQHELLMRCIVIQHLIERHAKLTVRKKSAESVQKDPKFNQSVYPTKRL